MIDGKLDLRDVDAGLRELSRAGHDLSPVFRKAAPAFKKSIRQSGLAREGPDGRWDRLAKSTLKARREMRRRGKKPAAAVLGKLRTAYKTLWDRDSLRAVSKVKWSAAHQDGAVVGRGAELPARTWLWVRDEFLTDLVKLIEKHLGKAF